MRASSTLIAAFLTTWCMSTIVDSMRVQVAPRKSPGGEEEDSTKMEIYEHAKDTGERHTFDYGHAKKPLSVGNAALDSLSGCDLARKVIKARKLIQPTGLEAYNGIEASWNDVIVWECLRCKPGYLEQATSFEAAGLPAMSIQTCVFKPCGDLCKSCSKTKKSLSPTLSFSYKCQDCDGTYPGYYDRGEIIDTHFTAYNEGKKVVIKKVCSAKLHSPTTSANHEPASLEIPPILESLMPRKIGDLKPLALLQNAAAFVRIVTAEFLATAKSGNETALDMVQDGTRFMDKVIKSVVYNDKFEHHLLKIDRSIAESQAYADARGALGLCAQVAFQRMGDDDGLDDQRMRTQKHCDSVDNALHRIQLAICAKVPTCSVPRFDATDFESLAEAPRRALDVLAMFGLPV